MTETLASLWCSYYQVSSLEPDFWFKQVQRDNSPDHYCIIVALSRWIFYHKGRELKGIPFSNYDNTMVCYGMQQKNSFHQEFLRCLFSFPLQLQNDQKILASAGPRCCGNYFSGKMHLELVLLALIAVLGNFAREMLCCKNFLHSYFFLQISCASFSIVLPDLKCEVLTFFVVAVF